MGACAALLRTASQQQLASAPLGRLSVGAPQPPADNLHTPCAAGAPAAKDDGSDLDTDFDINNLREQLAASGMQ